MLPRDAFGIKLMDQLLERALVNAIDDPDPAGAAFWWLNFFATELMASLPTQQDRQRMASMLTPSTVAFGFLSESRPDLAATFLSQPDEGD